MLHKNLYNLTSRNITLNILFEVFSLFSLCMNNVHPSKVSQCQWLWKNHSFYKRILDLVCMLFLRKKNPIIYFGEFYILAYLVLLCFTILHFAGTAFFLFFFFSRNWVFMANHEWSKSVSTSFSHRICSLCVFLLHFENSHHTSNFFLIIAFVMAIRDLWCYCFNCFGVP